MDPLCAQIALIPLVLARTVIATTTSHSVQIVAACLKQTVVRGSDPNVKFSVLM